MPENDRVEHDLYREINLPGAPSDTKYEVSHVRFGHHHAAEIRYSRLVPKGRGGALKWWPSSGAIIDIEDIPIVMDALGAIYRDYKDAT